MLGFGSKKPAKLTLFHPREAAALAKAMIQARQNGPGGAVLRLSGPKGLIWEGAYGYLDATGATAMTAATLFEVASITKTFTAALILCLAEDEAFHLDHKLKELLWSLDLEGLLVIDGQDYTSQITVRHLLSHTSGLPDYWYDPPFDADGANAFLRAFRADERRLWTPQEILAYLPDLAPIARPGTGRFHYADTNYLLLALLVESIEGRPYHTSLRERILGPLSLTETYLSYREESPVGAPLSHRFEDAVDLHGKMHQSADWGGGGLVSNAADLAVFISALASGQVFKQDRTYKLMQHCVPTGAADVGYGLGLFSIGLGSKGTLWGHDGHGNCFMYYWPEHKISLTGTLNQTEADWWVVGEKVVELLGNG